MAKLIQGDRVGRQGKIVVGSSAVLFDSTRQKILLTRRSDNGRWCIPGGAIEPGESAEEACMRELPEETGLKVEVERLIGVYSNPHRLIEYADGNRIQYVSLTFQAKAIGGTLGISDETTECGYFSRAEIEKVDVMEHHLERISDAFAARDAAFIR